MSELDSGRSEWVLYSDGGGERGSSAAGACVLAFPGAEREVRMVAYLGPGTNNEAEITAGLLGYSLLSVQTGDLGTHPRKVRWVCDSQYVLKSATEYILRWETNGWRTADKKPVKTRACGGRTGPCPRESQLFQSTFLVTVDIWRTKLVTERALGLGPKGSQLWPMEWRDIW